LRSWESRSATGRKAHAVLDLAVGPAEMAGKNDDRPLGEQRLDRRSAGHDPAVVGDLAVLERNVEIDADETRLPAASRSRIVSLFIVTRSGWARIGTGGHSDRPDPALALVRGARR